ncbi:amidase domain-containing protein [Streptomyces sp. NPDC026206]|uniref:amidase domain-containing protein n=1 Tax=Streptomyces sp. NPDC026206 TaxID=3157089 RepID=UPI0033C73557
MRRTARLAACAVVAAAMGLGAAPSALAAQSRTAEGAAMPAADAAPLHRIAESYLQQRADTVTATGRARVAPEPPQQATAELANRLKGEFRQLAAQGRAYEKASGGYTRAEVKVTPGEATEAGGTATVRLTEDTRLHYPNVRQGDPEAEEYSVGHTLTFTRDAAGRWLLASDKPDLGTGDVTTYLAAPAEGPKEPDADAEGGSAQRSAVTARPQKPAEAAKTAAASYDYDAMAYYANKYWKNPNRAFRTYDNDCTNFVSQAMNFGGWHETGGNIFNRKSNKRWFYGGHTWTTSYTWAGAENWYWFASKHSGRTSILRNVWDLRKADVLQADWGPRPNNTIDHTMIVTAWTPRDTYLTYHTGNTHNRKLSNLLAKRPDAWYYAHRT